MKRQRARRPEVDVGDVALTAYAAFALAVEGADPSVRVDGHLPDLPEPFRSGWERLAELLLGRLPEMEGATWPGIVGSLVEAQKEVMGPGPELAFGPVNRLGLEAFARTVAAFLDSENEEDDVTEMLRHPYDWGGWAKRKMEQTRGR